MIPPLYEPQLALTGVPAGPLAGWVMEPKLDGYPNSPYSVSDLLSGAGGPTLGCGRQGALGDDGKVFPTRALAGRTHPELPRSRESPC